MTDNNNFSLPDIDLDSLDFPKPDKPLPYIPESVLHPNPDTEDTAVSTTKFEPVESISTPKPYSLNLTLPDVDTDVILEIIKSDLRSMVPSIIKEIEAEMDGKINDSTERTSISSSIITYFRD